VRKAESDGKYFDVEFC
jgi:hypothetical protein